VTHTPFALSPWASIVRRISFRPGNAYFEIRLWSSSAFAPFQATVGSTP
jgi:hypothetical protein